MADIPWTSIDLTPSTTNQWLVAKGPFALYNPTLVLISNALSQHALIFGFFFLLRGFNARRIFDLHYIIFLLAITLSLAGLVFLADPLLDNYKIYFLLEHEAVEVVLAFRVLLPIDVSRKHPGRILFGLWSGLCVVSIFISLNGFHGHAADVVAWGAFFSDSFLAVSGFKLARKWYSLRPQLATSSSAFRTKIRAEGLAGIGCLLHGITTVCIAPIFTRILYHNLNPGWFAFGFAFVFAFAIFALGFMIPVIALFFSTINWGCCWHNRKVLLGEAQWTDVEEEEDETRSHTNRRKDASMGVARDVEEGS